MDADIQEGKSRSIVTKIIFILLLEVCFGFILLVFSSTLIAFIPAAASLLITWAEKSSDSLAIIESLYLTIFAIYFSMLSLRKIFIKGDELSIPRWLAIINVCLGIIFFLFDRSVLTGMFDIIVNPVLQYLVSYLFLRAKFKN